MDLRNLPSDLSPADRCAMRRAMIERELGVDLTALHADPEKLGHAEEKNCEQMFGHVPLPVGYAGPLAVRFSDGMAVAVHLPLATTEGALVASVNRGCKAMASGVDTHSEEVGITRSVAFRSSRPPEHASQIRARDKEWQAAAEATSRHLHMLGYDIDQSGEFLYLTLRAASGDAMGMNMVTLAAQAAGDWIAQHIEGLHLITIAANVDSDKKPSTRTRDRGRGISARAEATVPASVIAHTLKSHAHAMLAVAEAKLVHGSTIAGSLSANLHAANVIAALYLATGQDPAHVVEGSLATTSVVGHANGDLQISVHLPAILVGLLGGGTTLPAQRQCLRMLLGNHAEHSTCTTTLPPRRRLAESIAAAVLAGEISLLAAQASQTLAQAHKKLSR